MDEINKVPEVENNEEVIEQANPAPKAPIPKLPLIIGGAIAGVALITVAVVLILGGGKHKHSYGEWNVAEVPTCTVAGVEERVCECGEKETRPVAALGHTEVMDSAVAPTCTSGGLTEGKHCSECNAVITAQESIPMVAHTYDNKYDENCNICGHKRDAECAHAETQIIPGKPATCNATGLTDGSKCQKCGEILVSQVAIPVKPHTEVVDSAKAATCTSAGLTEGKHCSICSTVIIAQNIIPASHRYSDKYEYNDNYHWLKCSACGDEKKSSHNTDDEGICSVCSHIVSATSGVIYDISADGTYAEVIAYNGTAKKIRIADTYEGLPVKTIYNKAFYRHETITSVIIPDSVTTIGDYAFNSCYRLTSVVIGDSVTTIGNFAFNECYYLTSVVIGDSVTTIGNSAFNSCDSLTSVVIGDSVTTIGKAAFHSCDSLTSVVIGDSVTTIGGMAFYNCNRLTSVVIGDSVTTIGEWALSGCDSLQFNEYGNGKYLGTEDNPYFALIEVTTRNLSSYTIHEDTKIIADKVFSNCSRLTSIVIPVSVTSIGYEAFYGCSSLKDVYYTGSEAEWKEIAIRLNWNGDFPIYANIHYNYVPEN